MRNLLPALLILLGACSEENVALQPDNRICETPAAPKRGEWGACVHYQAYKLAKSPDPAEVVARAVGPACSAYVADTINDADPEERFELGKAITSSIEALALHRVIQARAGNCEIPK
jgi:hypothetical protein